MTRSEKDKMLAGELYDASATDLQAEVTATRIWLARYNNSLGLSGAERRALLLERLGAVGEGRCSYRRFIVTTATTSGSAPVCF